MPLMTGSDAVVQSLIAEEIDLVFGIPAITPSTSTAASCNKTRSATFSSGTSRAPAHGHRRRPGHRTRRDPLQHRRTGRLKRATPMAKPTATPSRC